MAIFSNRHTQIKASPIRDILKAIDVPGMVSFAGGLPSPESFPSLDGLALCHKRLQYGISEGDEDLRSFLARRLNQRGIDVNPEHVLILSGSQQGIDLVAKLFIDPETTVAIETPTYLAALQVFDFFGARYQCYEAGGIPDLTSDGQQQPAFLYTIPTFQNPTGYVYSTVERKRLAELCDQTGTVLFEDDPYCDLMFDECDRTPICSLLQKTSWIYQSSLSKTLAPGFRLGYLTCSPDLFPLLARLKQAADLHTNRLTQHLALTLLQHPDRETQLQTTLDQYRRKRDRFAELLTEHFKDIAIWEQPSGGLFFWLRLLPRYRQDTRQLLPLALQNNIAFMPGEAFYPNPSKGGNGTIRLNFSHAADESVEPALANLAALIRSIDPQDQQPKRE